jgi:hypothetical protein
VYFSIGGQRIVIKPLALRFTMNDGFEDQRRNSREGMGHRLAQSPRFLELGKVMCNSGKKYASGS